MNGLAIDALKLLSANIEADMNAFGKFNISAWYCLKTHKDFVDDLIMRLEKCSK